MNRKSLRTSIAAAMGGAVLLAGLLVGASFALAQETDEPALTEESTVEGDSIDDCFGSFRDRTHMLGENLDELLAELGLTMDELRDQIADGATLEEIAAEVGIDLDDVLAQLREDALAAIDDAVGDGALTEEQADSIKEKIEAFDPEDVLGFRFHGFGSMPDGMKFDGRGFGGGHDGFGFLGDMGGLFDDLDIDLDGLREQLESGASLDEALDSLGIDLNALATQAREEATAHIDEMVADGVMSQEQADSMKEMLEGIDFSEGLPFGIGGFRFGGELPDFDMDGFSGRRGHGHGFGFFGDRADDVNAEEALLDV